MMLDDWAEPMNELNLREHGATVKQLLVKKSLMDVNEDGREIQFEHPVDNAMQRYGLSKETLHRLIRDFPIRDLKSLNKTHYQVVIEGNYGRKHIHMELKLVIDRPGLDVSVVKLTAKQ